MKIRTMLTLMLAWSLTTVAAAQTKISGTVECGKPDAQHMLEVGDRQGHSLAIAQAKCTWTKPWEMEGIQNKESVSTFSHDHDASGNRPRHSGYFVDTMANGDKAFYRYEGPVALKKKEGAPATKEVNWTLFGGTGKLKGIKGKGVCKGKARPEGGLTWECEGEYALAK